MILPLFTYNRQEEIWKKTSKIDVFCRDPIHILFVCEKLPTSVTFIYSPHIQSYAWSEFDDSVKGWLVFEKY